jgi:hypothetical protein
MTKHHGRRTTLGRWWAFVTLWVAIVTLVFSVAGCSSAIVMAPLQVPPEKVRLVCWDPPEKGTGDEYFVFPDNSDEAVSESRAAFLTELRKESLIFKFSRGAPASSLNLIPLTRTDAWCNGIPRPPEWAQPLLKVCPEPIAIDTANSSPKQFVAQSNDPVVKSSFLCDQRPNMAPTSQELILLRARNDAYQMAYQQAAQIAQALTIAKAEMQEVLDKDDWTLRNLITSNPDSIEAIQARVAHELDSIEAPPAYDDPILDGLALAGFQQGFDDARFKAEATIFAIDAGWVVLDIAVTEVILGPLGGAKLAASGLSKGSKALKAAVARLGDIPIYLPVGVGGGGAFVKIGQFVNVSKIVASISASAHRYRLEKALKALKVPILRGPGESLHHIVAWDDDRAKMARGILKKFKIDIDDAANGVFLPATTKSVNPKGAMVHSTLHTDDYYRKVNRALLSAKNRRDAIKKLEEIRESLLKGAY